MKGANVIRIATVRRVRKRASGLFLFFKNRSFQIVFSKINVRPKIQNIVNQSLWLLSHSFWSRDSCLLWRGRICYGVVEKTDGVDGQVTCRLTPSLKGVKTLTEKRVLIIIKRGRSISHPAAKKLTPLCQHFLPVTCDTLPLLMQ